MKARFILASASPRRKQLLTEAGFQFDIVPAEIDESPKVGENPKDYVLRLSLEKAKRIASELPVLGADTVVSINGVLLGKPTTPDEAFNMLKQLVGKTHLVHTGVSVVQGDREKSVVSETSVAFIDPTDEQLIEYIQTGEPFDKAGGYGIQGKGRFLIKSVHGSYTGVVGLPVEESIELLKNFGILGGV